MKHLVDHPNEGELRTSSQEFAVLLEGFRVARAERRRARYSCQLGRLTAAKRTPAATGGPAEGTKQQTLVGEHSQGGGVGVSQTAPHIDFISNHISHCATNHEPPIALRRAS
jgi:hypothetical protein